MMRMKTIRMTLEALSKWKVMTSKRSNSKKLRLSLAMALSRQMA